MQRDLISRKAGRRAAGQGRAMWTYRPRHVADSAPRYTSYPTAAEFGDGVGAADQAAALAAVPWDARLSLYLHVPYCEKICWYCGCNTGAANRLDRVAAYADALHTEVAAVGERLAGRGTVESIHFGGGSPNILPPARFAGLVAALRRRFSVAPVAEIAVELDPRSLDAAKIAALAEAGVSRVSLGVQTFSSRVQAKINRVQPYEMVAAGVADLRRAGIGAINLDLMYGLPGQLVGDLLETIELSMALAPDRLALFGYAHMPSRLPRQRMIADIDLPGPVARFAQARVGHQRLVELGYVPVGFDHFARVGDALAQAARDGRLRRNFQGFTVDPADCLIGLGASAISELPDLLVQNEKDAGRYRALAGAGRLAGTRGVHRTAADRLRGAVIEALLCRGEADVGAICGSHGFPQDSLDESVAKAMALACDDLVAVDGRKVSIPAAALPYSRLVARCFDAYRAGAPAGRFSRTV